MHCLGKPLEPWMIYEQEPAGAKATLGVLAYIFNHRKQYSAMLGYQLNGAILG